MADPVIRIVIEEGHPGQQPGARPGGGAPSPGPPGRPVGGGGGSPAGGEDEEDQAGSVAKAMKAWLGRRIPGGQKTFKLLGIDDVFDTLAEKIGPAIKRVSAAVHEALEGVLGKPKPGGGHGHPADAAKDALKDTLREHLAGGKGRQGYSPENVGTDLLGKGQGFSDKAVSTDFLGKGSKAATAAEGSWSAPAAAGGATLLADVAGVGLALTALGEAGEAAAQGIRGLGQAGAEIVMNDPGAALRRVADGVIESLGQIPIIGKAITTWPKVFMAVGDAANQLKEAFLQNARKLAEYSGAISAAEAMADVRHILADLREANRTGPRLAEVVTLQSQIEVELQNAMIPLKEDLLEVLVPIMQATLEMAKLLPYAVDELRFLTKVGYELTLAAIPGGKTLDLLWEGVKKYLASIQDDQAKGDFNELAKAYMAIDTGLESAPQFAQPPGNGLGGLGG